MIRVLGDIMLDRWITGEVNRMSPEAPVPVFLEKTKNHSLGGAANLAINIHRLGSYIKLYGSIGNDENGSKIIDLLNNEKINHDLIFSSGPTTTKTRYIDNKSKHYFRWDVEIITPNSKIIEIGVKSRLYTKFNAFSRRTSIT